MTKEEMIAGFAEGRELIQQLDHLTNADELNKVDECIKEGLCTVSSWYYHLATGCIRREMKGIIKNEQS